MPPIGLGGAPWSLSDPTDDDLSIRTIHAAIDAGVRLIDTAHAYTKVGEVAHNEHLIGRALSGHPRGSEVLVATKGGHSRTGIDRYPIDGRPETIRRHVELSLRALGTERIGLYQLHWPDPVVPLTESVQALVDLQEAGLVEMIGLSNVSAEQLSEARGVGGIAAVQNSLSPWRTDDRALIETAARLGIAYLAYSPFGGEARVRTLAAALPHTADRAARLGLSVQQVILLWELGLGENVIPIVGARRPESILASFQTVELALSREDWRAVDDEITALNESAGHASTAG